MKKEALYDSSKKREVHYGTGRRKTSAARVFLKTLGTGKITVNNRPLAPLSSESAAAESAPPSAETAPAEKTGKIQPPAAGTRRGRAQQQATGQARKPGVAAAPYFVKPDQIQAVLSPLKLLNAEKSFDIFATVRGGGPTGQAGALRHGIARSLLKVDSSYRALLKEKGFLTRDSRMVERKKYGLRKARKSPQFSKR